MSDRLAPSPSTEPDTDSAMPDPDNLVIDVRSLPYVQVEVRPQSAVARES